MKQWIGYGMVTAGFVGAALVSVLDAEALVWWQYVVCLVTGIAGVVLIRSHVHEVRTEPNALAGNMKFLVDCMTRVVDKTKAYLEVTEEHEKCLAMHRTIDEVLVEDLREFAEARESITHLHGLEAYADVMSSFATGERYLNRVWSASADGYVDEVALYMPQVHTQFSDCLNKLKQLH